MNEHRQGVDVAKVLGIVGRRWKTVLAITLLAAMAAYGYVTYMAKPVYESTALVSYQAPDRSSNPTGGALPSSGITREDVQTLVAIADNQQVVEAAAKELGIRPGELRQSVHVQAHGEASIVAFIARSGDSKEAARRANAWATAFVGDRVAAANQSLNKVVNDRKADLKVAQAEFRRQPADDKDPTAKNTAFSSLADAEAQKVLWTGAIKVSNQAQEPDLPIWPKKLPTLIAAILIGLGIGSGVALLTARVDNRLRGDDFDALPAPVIARVPMSPRAPKATPLGPAMAEPIVADSFAALGSRVMLDRFGDGAHVILVTSARSGEGKSSVAANLASALALGGRRVVLVDADMRRPTQDVVFPMLQNRPGLSQVLTRGAELEASLTLVAPNLAAIASGPRHSNASVLLASVAFRQMLDRLAQISEVIVIDAPPVLAVKDALAVAPAANQVLLVARVGSSDIAEVAEAHSYIASAAQTPQAMVLVGTERPEGYGYDQELRVAPRVAMPSTAPQAQQQRPTAQPPAAGQAPAASGNGAAPAQQQQQPPAPQQGLPSPPGAAGGRPDGAVA
ncbi:MAG: polysaccharide biosynthesis tyrosine autokinase [Thermoleophilia bacterium]|nr:polysaccharide biosynthesis tyrosine autokinase [Thermoleophilia bacterium]